jgi:hypothetical protein
MTAPKLKTGLARGINKNHAIDHLKLSFYPKTS